MSDAHAQVTSLAQITIEADEIDWPTQVPVVDVITAFNDWLFEQDIFNLGNGMRSGHQTTIYIRHEYVDEVLEWLEAHDVPVECYHTGGCERLGVNTDE